ncbi:hypothetical protein EFE23_03710 [Micromonospora solifontis]|uniref:YbaB/EbfC DNA-binding family protein n=1 Tax=Micromonospora solifontis TaxID=2487138 RepID=A0ABX9WNB7_9ACTN|nr:hypothetical protein EFE23_03710 [Micromonospora solifontis]
MIPGPRPSDSDEAPADPQADVHSPDRSVRIIASSHGDVEVHVQGLHRHSDDSLARQVRAAARLALASLQQARREVEFPRDERRPEG